MVTVEEPEAELIRKINEAWGDWELVAELAEKILQITPKSFDAATALQAACIEIAAKIGDFYFFLA